MTTKPLPPMGQDPSIIEGQHVRAGFTPRMQGIRQNRSLTNLQVAEEVVNLWTEVNTKLQTLYVDLQTRRRARLESLEGLVPLGPAVPDGASPADVAVIQQAFRVALAQAREAMPTRAHDPSGPTPLRREHGTLDAMLADAERFDDDTLRRAVLTAAYETGNMKLLRGWTDLIGVTSQVEEYAELQSAIAGQGQAGSWNMTVFRPLAPPPEVADLERLRAAEEAAVLQRVRGSVAATRYRN